MINMSEYKKSAALAQGCCIKLHWIVQGSGCHLLEDA